MSGSLRKEDGRVFRPPARAVIVHTSLMFGNDAINALCESLLGVVALALSLSGVSRLPFLGLTATGPNSPSPAFPLQHMRTANFSKLQAALDAIKTFLLHSLACDDAQTTGELFQSSLGDVLSQHHSQSTTFHQLAGYLPQLDVVIVTPMKRKEAKSVLQHAVQTVDLQMVKRLQVVCVCEQERSREGIDDDKYFDETSLDEGEGCDDEDEADIIDIITITPDVLHFNNIFKQWLQDDSTEQEHVHIHLPTEARSPVSIALKCDIVERILPPTQLPGPKSYSLQTATLECPARAAGRSPGNAMSLSKTLTSPGQSTADSPWPHHLRALATVKTSGICDSVIFGTPLLLRPTSCWRLDWEELECNQHRFSALAQQLSDQNEAILVAQEVSLPGLQRGVMPRPMSHFMVMACQSSSALLIKPVAIGDAVLPVNLSAQATCNPAAEHVDAIRISLKQLEAVEVYNPLLFPGFLSRSLVSRLASSASETIGSKKRKPINRSHQPLQPSKKQDRGQAFAVSTPPVHRTGAMKRNTTATAAATAAVASRPTMPYGSQAPIRQGHSQRYNPVAVAKPTAHQHPPHSIHG